MRIVCLGDSICYGEGVRPDRAWVALLAAGLARDWPSVRVRNAGVSGETAEDGLARVHALLQPEAPAVMYVQFGLNDAWQQLYGEGQYDALMREIVFRAKDAGVRTVMVATNHPVWVEEDMYGRDIYPGRVRLFNRVLREAFMPQQPQVVFVDMEAMWDETCDASARHRLLQGDGVHLSEDGNAFYARMLLPVFLSACADCQASGQASSQALGGAPGEA